ncbi:MAG: hypothetical protein FWF78_01435 [Defluviitaleaceae bacterium]|nr:hypothetical protein [Defluviitaleaceae bacterium]
MDILQKINMKGKHNMIKCKKQKYSTLTNHQRNTKPDCQNCAYFSTKNCGSHASGNMFGDFPA